METKQCIKCKQNKSIDSFPFRNKKKGILRTHCRECHSKIMKERYVYNKEQLDKTKEGKKCEKCGYCQCVEALDYHHIDPTTKVDTVARLATHYNLAAGLAEIDKCILLCANCHREFHFLERNKGMTIEQFIAR